MAGDGWQYSEPGHSVTLISTHGAGDCFIGTMIADWWNDNALPDAVKSANLAAAKHVSREV